MHTFTRSLCVLLLVLGCLPVFAGNDCPAIRTLAANDVQTGEPVTITWSYSGGALQSQTLSGQDFPAPVLLAPGQTSYTYTPAMPGEKHVTLSAATACGTVAQTAKYHVKQCNVVPPPMTVSATSVAPGDVLQAAVTLQPGHTARWEVTNGTASATTGSAISVTAGGAGTVTITAFVSRGSSCAVGVTQSVQVVEACPITEPQMWHPQQAFAGQWFSIILPGFEDPSYPLTATFTATGANIEYYDPAYVGVVAPAQGSFTIAVTVSNGTCSRTYTRTFEVEACTAAAVVKAGQIGECGATTAVAELTGVAPFQGSWSDGQYFFTWDNRIERPIGDGTYTINYMYDMNCQATVSGSVQGTATLPMPYFTIDPVVNGSYWSNDTCPGLERVARIEYPTPGATPEWTVTNGTILSGQGTPELHFAATGAGEVNVSAVNTSDTRCPSAPYNALFPLRSLGAPEFTITVQPAVIKAGETALVTIHYERPEFASGMSIFSSLGDSFQNVYGNTWEYRSNTSRTGQATITVTADNRCGNSITHTATLTIETAGPSAKVQAAGYNCDYYAYAALAGTPPFTGTWSNGETFTSDYPSAYLWVSEPGTYTLTSFSDATGPGPVTGSATFNFTPLPPAEFTLDTNSVCPNGVVTATLITPIPAGTTPMWYVNNGEILSGQGTASAQIRAYGYGQVSVRFIGASACSPHPPQPQELNVKTAQIPYFTAYPVYEGGTTVFEVRLDPNTATWGFENSLGDLIEIIENPGPNHYVLRYTSTHGQGTSNIRVYGATTCGESFEWSQTIQIIPPPPAAVMTSTPNATCGNDVTVTITGGVAPYTITWSDGQTFTIATNTQTRHFNNSIGWVQVYGMDAGGYWFSSEYISVPTTWEYYPVTGPNTMCEGTTATVTTDLPAGWTVNWDVWNGVEIVSGQGTSTLTVRGIGAEQSAWVNATFTTPEGCVSSGGTSIYVRKLDVANPVISLPASTIRAGESFDFTIAFDGNAYEYMRYETSNSDGLGHLNQRGMTFDLRYQSYNGPGEVTIKAYGMTTCGKYVESTATLTITE